MSTRDKSSQRNDLPDPPAQAQEQEKRTGQCFRCWEPFKRGHASWCEVGKFEAEQAHLRQERDEAIEQGRIRFDASAAEARIVMDQLQARAEAAEAERDRLKEKLVYLNELAREEAERWSARAERSTEMIGLLRRSLEMLTKELERPRDA